jgi:hypothetical protein
MKIAAHVVSDVLMVVAGLLMVFGRQDKDRAVRWATLLIVLAIWLRGV